MNKALLLTLLSALALSSLYLMQPNQLAEQPIKVVSWIPIPYNRTILTEQPIKVVSWIPIPYNRTSKPLTMNNNFKVRSVKGCNLLSGFSLLHGCVPSAFANDDLQSLVDGPASSVKISLTELSQLQDIKEVYDYKTNIFGVSLVEQPISLKFKTTHDFRYRHSWVLTDLRTKDKRFYRSTRDLELSEQTMTLLTENPEQFMKTYGEMYVSGFVTGAEFNGYMTLSTNDESIYEDATIVLGSSPSEQLINQFKQKYGNKVDIDIDIISSIPISNKQTVFTAHNEFQEKMEKVGMEDKDRVTLILSNYDSLSKVMRAFRSFPQSSQDYINGVKRLKDRTLQRITEALQVYKLLEFNLNTTLSDIDGENPILFRNHVKELTDLLNIIQKNQRALSSLDLSTLQSIEENIFEADSPVEFEILVSKVQMADKMAQDTLRAERIRIQKEKEEAERRRREEEERRKREEEERIRREEEERKRKEEEERKKNEAEANRTQLTIDQEALIKKTPNVTEVTLNKTATFAASYGQMKFYKIYVPITSSDISGEVTLKVFFKKLGGQVNIYYSNTEAYPYAGKRDFWTQSDSYSMMPGYRGEEFADVPVIFQKGVKQTYVYISLYALERSSVEIVAIKL